MKNADKKKFLIGAGFLAAFVLWTVLVSFVDVRAIGPNGSSVGFAALNGYVHKFTGVNFHLYTITDWLGLVPIGVAFGFAILGLVQWIKRKSLLKVDRSLLALGGFYVVVLVSYIFKRLFLLIHCARPSMAKPNATPMGTKPSQSVIVYKGIFTPMRS